MLKKILAAQVHTRLESFIRNYLKKNHPNLGKVCYLKQLSNRESQVYKVVFENEHKKIPYCFKIAPKPNQEPCYFNYKFEERFTFESELLSFCKAKELDTACIVPRVDNEFFEVTEKGIFMMYEFADGQPVGKAVVIEPVLNETVKTVFKWLGKFHATSSTFENDIKPNRSKKFMFNSKVQEQRNQKFKDQVSAMENRVKLIDTYKKNEGIDTWLIGPIHGDFHAENMHLNKTKLYVIDWELCGIGFRLWDIGTAIRSLKLSKKQLDLAINSYVKAFTDNLTHQENISNLIKEFGTNFAQIRHLWFHAMHCDRKSH